MKFPLTKLKLLIAGHLALFFTPSCNTVNYVMWEWNPFQPTPTNGLVTTQSTLSQQPRSYSSPQPYINTPITVQTPAPAPQPTPVAFIPPPTNQAAPSLPVGKVQLQNGIAVAPFNAPLALKKAVAAGNRLQNKPYKFGGGHANLNDDGYDCSGTVSYVLREAHLMTGSNTSKGFKSYGEAGEGKHITVWTKDGHAFIILGGLRLDTGGSLERTGPRWKPGSRNMEGFIPRHPPGL